MNRNVLITVVILLAIGGIGFALFSGSNTGPDTNEPTATTTEPSATSTQATSSDSHSNADQRTIQARHQFNPQEERHIVAGELDLPTPCHTIETDVETSATNTQAVINFTVEQSDTDQMCAQVITPKQFNVSFNASQNYEITATYNGSPADLQLTEVSKSENLEANATSSR